MSAYCGHDPQEPDCLQCLHAVNGALRDQVAAVREILAHTVMGSLPDDWPLKDIAEARLHDMIGLRNQVRDTCQRAERAEAALNKSMEIVSEYYPDAMGELVLRVEAVCMLGRMAHDASFAAQSTIADLNGQMERMREAIEKAPHTDECDYLAFGTIGNILPGDLPCNCWKRAALGGAE